jgi:ABC-type transport system involved in multi-copper enzyme maturation permease subunit
MLLQLLTIAKNTFIESVRQPVLFLLVMLSGLFQLLNTWNTGFSMGQEESGRITGDNKLLLDVGLATIFVIGTLLAGFIATAVMSREIENKTVLTVVSKPVSRWVLVLGKYAGVAGAILAAVIIMIIFLLMGIRHGVMSTAADDVDMPVVLFTLLAVFLSLAIAGWCNYFYGWNFPQTAVGLMVPFLLLAYFLVLLISPKWKIQPISHDLNFQVLMAAASLAMALLVLTAVATAASTRLGQVMTIVVCCAVFVGALLSNHFIGRYVFNNTALGVISRVAPEDPERAMFDRPGDTLNIQLEQPAGTTIPVKSSFYYSPTPNGFPMLSKEFAPFDGDLTNANDIIGAAARPALVITQADRQHLRVRNVGAQPVLTLRPPLPGDYVFLGPTKINPAAMAAWVAVPNLQFFWLLDAVTQNRPIPPAYVTMVFFYALAQIGAFLSLAVILFQKRDVG